MVPHATPTSYYGRPVLKAPTWKWPIPAYLFTGGVAAGSALMAAGARTLDDEELAGHLNLASFSAATVSAGLLIADLGRPARFHHMLRVVKPTSPMSVGTWIFSAFSASSALGVAATGALRAGAGPARSLGTVAGLAQFGAAVLAPALGTYTAVLLADTAVPAWHEARRQLPLLFAGSATASGGAVAAMIVAARRGPSPGASALRALTVVAGVSELAAERAMHRHLATITTGEAIAPDLAAPYRRGRAGRLAKGARAATAVGTFAVAVSRRNRLLGGLGGLALLAGSAMERFAIVAAGAETTRHPAYTFGPQRAGLVPATKPS